MSTKTLIWIGLFVGSTVRELIPGLFHAGIFSGWGIIGVMIGGILGIWAGYKLGQNYL